MPYNYNVHDQKANQKRSLTDVYHGSVYLDCTYEVYDFSFSFLQPCSGASSLLFGHIDLLPRLLCNVPI